MESIRKPDVDAREYRLVKLTNNLEAMIISDANTNQCTSRHVCMIATAPGHTDRASTASALAFPALPLAPIAATAPICFAG